MSLPNARLGKLQQAWLDLICRSNRDYSLDALYVEDLKTVFRLRELGLVQLGVDKKGGITSVPTKMGLAAWHKLTEKGDFKNVLYAPSKPTENQK